MSFFEPLPPQPPHRERPRPPWAGPPGNELPVGVPGELLLARSELAAVSVGVVHVYSTGFEFSVTAIGRPGHRSGFSPLQRHHGVRDEDLLRLGIRCADGTRAELDRRPSREEPPTRVLWARGGSGDELRSVHRYWSWPLPPPGPVEFLCLWPGRDIGESSASLDGAAILEAAARVEQLWPDDEPDGTGGGGWTRYGP